MLPPRFPFFGGSGGGASSNSTTTANNRNPPNTTTAEFEFRQRVPTLKIQPDKDVYRPGDPLIVTIQISNPDTASSLLLDRIGFEIRAVEKLDSQWFATHKPLPGSKQRRGEFVFVECAVPSMVSNQIVSAGATKSYVVRTVLPDIIPPSYKGATIRYFYYVKSTLFGQWLILENGHSHRESVQGFTELEDRIPLQVWVTQKTSGLLMEDGQSGGIVPSTTIQMDIFWKEMDGDSDWVRANDIYDGVEEGYESSRDEISSVSSYNPMKENVHKTFGSSLSLQSSTARSLTKDIPNVHKTFGSSPSLQLSTARSLTKDIPYLEGERTSLSSNAALPPLSAEVLYDSSSDVLSPQKEAAIVSPGQQQKLIDDDTGVTPSLASGAVEPVASEGFIRGRSYNIRLDDQVLLRFSPKNSDSTYYFSDMIGGTLTFFHEEGARRCLEVSITLETLETVNQRFIHPSRRNSPTITKVQSDHYEVVADLVQTSFLFSIPMDGPMSFSTPHVSVQWSLRFEFFTTPKNVDWASGRPLADRPELTLVDDRDLGTQASAGQSAGGSIITSLTFRIERLQLLLKPKKKPPGLSQEALDCLHLEVFSCKVEGAASRASQDCSICLETFMEGDALICLPCSHSFHSACLDPWLQTCGDCPYCCRTITIVTSHNNASKS